MNNLETTTLIDIQAPPNPMLEEPRLWLAVLLTLLLIFALTTLWRYWQRSLRQQSLRQLCKLEEALTLQTLTIRNASFRLSFLLQRRFGVRSIHSRMDLPPALKGEQARWTAFAQRMTLARYAKPSCSTETMTSLLQEARYWIRRWP